MILIAYVFPKLETRKTCLCKCLKSRISVQPSTLNMLKGPEHCWNSHDSRFIIFGHHSEKFWRPFFNISTLDEKYFPGNRENWRQPIQMNLSEKLIVFSQVFTSFVKCKFNSEHFEKKMSLIVYASPKL